jgi:hypothetical protein
MEVVVMSARNSLSRPEASQYLLDKHGIKRSPATLAKQASQGGGPKYRRVGLRQVIYETPHLDEYAKSIVTAPAAHSKEHDALREVENLAAPPRTVPLEDDTPPIPHPPHPQTHAERGR